MSPPLSASSALSAVYSFSLAKGQEAAERYVAWAANELQSRYPATDFTRARVTYLDAGIMNYVYRVDTPERTFFLKQALARVKQHERLGPDLAGVSPARIQVEWRALSLLSEELAPPFRDQVPRPAWYDWENNVLWTEEAVPGGVSLQEALQAGTCDVGVAERLGRLLGAIQGVRTGEVAPLWPTEEEDQANWERFLRMRTTGVLERAALPPAAEEMTRSLFNEGLRHARKGMLSHLDAAPKNVLVGPEATVALLDFELGAAVSDPAYDPGFLAGHYLLMGENNPGMRAASLRAYKTLQDGYMKTAPYADVAAQGRMTRYAALTMLYRLYGSSPAPFLDPERYAAIREEGIRLLLSGEPKIK